jgi:hypothetical protein
VRNHTDFSSLTKQVTDRIFANKHLTHKNQHDSDPSFAVTSLTSKIKNNDDQNVSDNETATFVADLDSDHSITKHHSDSEQVFTVQDSIIGCSRSDIFSNIEAFTFLPLCSKCDHYNGYKIGNPYAQTDLKGKAITKHTQTHENGLMQPQ